MLLFGKKMAPQLVERLRVTYATNRIHVFIEEIKHKHEFGLQGRIRLICGVIVNQYIETNLKICNKFEKCLLTYFAICDTL